MKKTLPLIVCLLAMVQITYSQSRTITTLEQLSRKLNRDCNVSNYKSSAVYYAKFVVKEDSIMLIDYRNIKDTLLQQTLERCLKKNAQDISWKSILGVNCDTSKTFNVILPFVIMSNYKSEKSGTDYTLAEVYENFFSQPCLNASVAYLLPAIYMEVSCYHCGSGISNEEVIFQKKATTN